MVVLLAHILKWQHLTERRQAGWVRTITAQRKEITFVSEQSPSLGAKLREARWLDMVWARAVALAVTETGWTASLKNAPLIFKKSCWPKP